MTEHESRLAELELRYLRQQDLVEQLNEVLVTTNQTVDLLERRVARLEQTLEGVVHAVDAPANEKPPHY